MKKIIVTILLLFFCVKSYAQSNCVDIELSEVSYSPAVVNGFNNISFGYDRTVVGDVNGDGYDDMIVISHPQDLSTRMWIVFLNEQGDMINLKQVYKGNESGVQKMFGFYKETLGITGAMDVGKLASIGDVNGDGVPDILIAVNRHQNAHNEQKGAYGVGLLNRNGDIIQTTTVQAQNLYAEASSQTYCEAGIDAWHRMGISVDVIGDVNGDRINDIVIGATLNGGSSNGSRDTQGRAYIVLLDTDGSPLTGGVYAVSSPTTTFSTPCQRNEQYYEEFGNIVAGIGDIDGNGVPDIAVGSPDLPSDSGNPLVNQGKGKIHIYLLGNNGKPISAPITITDGVNGLQIDNLFHFGSGIAPIGDINCDGVPDIIVSGNTSSALYILQLNNQGNLIHHQRVEASPSTTFPNGINSLSFGGLLEIDKGKDWAKQVNNQLTQDGINDILVFANNNANYFWRLSFSRTCECTSTTPCETTATTTLTFPAYQLKEVINTSAQTLSDNWLLSKDIPLLKTNGSRIDDLYTRPYVVGKQGIWRGESSFAYVTDRKQSAGINLKKDGTYTLNMFNWKYLGELDCPEWRKVETVSEYHPQSSDVERYNILKLYSSFHIGYSDQLVSAAAANSKQYEFGFEGFEEYTDDIYYANANLLFSTFEERRLLPIPYWFTLETGRNRRIWAPLELQTLQNQYSSSFTQLHVLGKQIDVNYPSEFRSHTTFEEIMLDNDKALIKFSLNEATPFEGFWTGKVGVTINKLTAQTFNGAQPKLVDGIAHTGTKSLKIDLPASFNQPYLLLIPNKKYVVSAWVRVDEADKPVRIASYQELASLQVEFGDRTTIQFKPEGQIIEGWQRIEGSFIVPKGGMGEWNIQLINTKGLATYFDDMRLFPSLGNMESFVYDTETFRLEAKLDANNYATFYYYDAEGRLYLVKQETAKGVQTLQTVTTHTKRGN